MTEASAVGGQGAAPVAPVAPTAQAPVDTGAVSTTASREPVAAPAGFDWAKGADELTSGYIQNKGWDNPLKAVESYRNLEKLLGADKAGNAVIIPKAEADAKEWNAVFDRLGRPSAPDGYKVQMPEGGDPEFHKASLGKFHELGLTQKQGETLMGWYNQTVQDQMQKMEAQRVEAFNAEEAQIKQEWGAAYTQNLAAAQSAARGLGLNADTIDALSSAMGHKATMNLLAQIGSKLGEDKFVSGDLNTSFGNAMTPAQAKSQIQSLMSDKDFTAKYLKGDADAKARMVQLHAFAYPDS